MFFIFLLFKFLLFNSIYQKSCAEIVQQWNKWPVPVESMVNFTINKYYDDKSELLLKIVNEKDEVLSHKYMRVTKKYYVDQSTDYFVIKKEKYLHERLSFLMTMSFYQKSFGHFLLFEYCEKDNKNCSLISKSQIMLTKEWRIEIKVEVLEYQNQRPIYIDDTRYFQPGKKVKVSCSAFDGLPQARIYVDENLTKRFREISYDEALNQWVGYLMLDVGDHNRNLTCHISGTNQSKSYNIIVNHPTTSVKLNPDYSGYISNGSTVSCQPLDGYPIPKMKWDFVSPRNNSNPNLSYEIRNDNLTIISAISVDTVMEFNCSAYYTNPVDQKVTVVTKLFQFRIGDKPNHAANLNKAAIGAGVAGFLIMAIAVMIVIMLCRSKPKPSRSSSNQQQGSPKYAGSLLAGSKSALRNQVKSQNGSNSALMTSDSSATANTDKNELNYDDMPRGRRPIKVVDDPVIYSTIVGTMQPKSRPSLDLGPIDRV